MAPRSNQDERLEEACNQGYLVSHGQQAGTQFKWSQACDRAGLPVIFVTKLAKYYSVRYTAWPNTHRFTDEGMIALRSLAMEHNGRIRALFDNYLRIDGLPESAARQIALRLATWSRSVGSYKAAVWPEGGVQ